MHFQWLDSHAKVETCGAPKPTGPIINYEKLQIADHLDLYMFMVSLRKNLITNYFGKGKGNRR